jgi:hypothetical protein
MERGGGGGGGMDSVPDGVVQHILSMLSNVRDVAACACVCRRWRDAAVSVVRPPLESGRITFPSSLKQVRQTPPPIW